MNEAPADLNDSASDTGWSSARLVFLIAFALAAHVAFLFLFGSKKPVTPRALERVPQLQLAIESDELLALDDPTLFALPHANDYATAFWQRPPAVAPPDFRWSESPRYLPLTVAYLGGTFREFMRTNPPVAAAPDVLNFRPPPPVADLVTPFFSPLPTNSTVQLTGDLAHRRLLRAIIPPSLPFNDVIAASRVQLLVNPVGDVVSTALLPSDSSVEALGHWDEADQRALTLARTARFAPAAQMTLGEMVFNWHTVPATNTTANPQR